MSLSEKYSNATVNTYHEFLFKSQFSRRITPMLFILSAKPIKYTMWAGMLYFVFPEYKTYILGVLAYLIIRAYTSSQMKYKDVLQKWVQGRDDESIRILSFLASSKERYIKENIEIKNKELE